MTRLDIGVDAILVNVSSSGRRLVAPGPQSEVTIRLTRSMLRYGFLQIPSQTRQPPDPFPPDRTRIEVRSRELIWETYVASNKISRMGSYFKARRLRVGDQVRLWVVKPSRRYFLEP